MEDVRKAFDLPDVDPNIIEDLPWAKEMLTDLQTGLNKSFLYWCQIVKKIGESEDQIKTWVKVFKNLHEETCCDMVSDMENLQETIIEQIEGMLNKLQELCVNTLQIEIPDLSDQKRTLCQEKHKLRKLIQEYENVIGLRQSEITELRRKQLDLCNNLGREPKIIRESPLLSIVEIGEFKKYIEDLENEKFQRLESFFSAKENIIEIMRELKLVPTSDFEKNVLSSDDSAFLLTDSNMKQLTQLQRNLARQQKKAMEEIALLRSKIDDLWNLLDVDLKDREEFRQKYTGNSILVLDALRLEVKRCEDLKKANIKVFIDKLRIELQNYWNKCHTSDASISEFKFFYVDCYNEDLLELHEMELNKWKKYYNDNKDLLTLIEKHRSLWNTMVELEENAAGPNRFNNRGGQLLKEEKERNKLAKEIPKVEEQMKALADKYELHHNATFTSYGETIYQYIMTLHEDRENAKKQKLSARKMQRDQTVLTPAKSALSLFPSTSHHNFRSGTPVSALKRKMGTPVTDNKKKLKLVLSEKKSRNINTPSVAIIKMASSAGLVKRISQERRKRLKIIRRSIKNHEATNITHHTTSTDYGDFQNELSNRTGCRSTIIPSNMPLNTITNCGTTQCPSTLKPSTIPTPSTSKPFTTPKTGSKTPVNKNGTSRTPESVNKLGRAKTNLKLIF